MALLIAVSANAGPSSLSAGTTAELSYQLGDEIRNVLQVPYLRYSSDNLKGELIVEATVARDGKIIFRGLKSDNDKLRENVYAKLVSMNLWASPDLASTLMRYRVKFVN